MNHRVEPEETTTTTTTTNESDLDGDWIELDWICSVAMSGVLLLLLLTGLLATCLPGPPSAN